MSEHPGRRRRPARAPVARLAVLLLALTAIAVLLVDPGPVRSGTRSAEPSAAPLVVLTSPPPAALVPIRSSGRLTDGTPYVPRLFTDLQASIGTATDASSVRLVVRAGARVVTVRRLSLAQAPQFDAFAASGQTVVWAQTVSGPNGVRTSLWRTTWRDPGRAVLISADAGAIAGSGGSYDLVLHDARVSWATSRTGGQTQVRSIGSDSRNPGLQTLSGRFVLSAWPWAVSADGPGTAARLVNLSGGAGLTLRVAAGQVATCGPVWCRVDTTDGSGLARIELVHPDGSGRVRLAGAEAIPAVADATLLDRYVPLRVDTGSATELRLFDAATGRTVLLGTDPEDLRAYGSMLWWSTGSGVQQYWNVVDLSTL